MLDGFPKTIDQVDMIDKMKIQPSFVIVLELSDEEVIKRLKNRRIDPVTGSVYIETAPTMTIQSRLQPLTNSHPKKIDIR